MMSHPKARDTLPDILNVQDIDPEETSDITEKSLVNPDFVEAVEVKQESELESVEIKSEITEKAEKSLGNQDLAKVKQESKQSKDKIVQIYQCDICGKSLHTKGGRKDHMKTCQNRQNQRSKNLEKIRQKMKKLKKKQALLYSLKN